MRFMITKSIYYHNTNSQANLPIVRSSLIHLVICSKIRDFWHLRNAKHFKEIMSIFALWTQSTQ